MMGLSIPQSCRRVLICTVAVCALALFFLKLLPRMVPWDGEEYLSSLSYSLRINDRHGRELQILPVDENGLRRIFIPYGELPRELLRIIRKSEDRRFYLHPGVDPAAMLRAAVQYKRWGVAVSGGSTISMQLARIILPRERNSKVDARVKLKEMWQALQIESRFSKNEVLELYVNLIPFGRNIEGYPAAARYFFNRDLSELSNAEFCVLAVIPRAPNIYDPLLQSENNLKAARALSERTHSASKSETERNDGRLLQEYHFRLSDEPGTWPFEAPHFVRRLIKDVDTWPEDNRRGFKPLTSTLDLEIQKPVEQLLARQVEKADTFRISNGAVIVADPRSAEVLAYLGSADFRNDEDSGQIDGAMIPREPGSTLKPFLYASLLDEGWTASTILPDIPSDFGGQYIYTPENYNEQYHGPVRLRRALAASLNIPAVYALEHLGVDSFTDTLIDAGFSSLTDQRGSLGVSLAVGGAQLSLSELLGGYLTLYAGGMYRNLRFIMDEPSTETRVWSAESADIITDIISSVDDRVMTFGRSGPVRFDYPVAIKTGTSNQFNNIWALGFAADIAAAVWMGNFDGSTVMAAPGSSIPAELLHEIFDSLSKGGELPRHANLESSRICSVSGMAATAACPHTMNEIFAPGTVPNPCSWHSLEHGRLLSTTEYPQEYAYWADRYNYRLKISERANLDILYPAQGATFFMDPNAPPGSQMLKLRLIGSGRATLRANGATIHEGMLPFETLWPMQPGTTFFLLEQGNAEVSRHIEVR